MQYTGSRFSNLRSVRSILETIQPGIARDQLYERLEAAHAMGGDIEDLLHVLGEDCGEYMGSWLRPNK